MLSTVSSTVASVTLYAHASFNRHKAWVNGLLQTRGFIDRDLFQWPLTDPVTDPYLLKLTDPYLLHPLRDDTFMDSDSFFSLSRPNYSNMKWPYNCLVKKIVIGQIDRSISHYFYSRINLFCKKIQSRGGFLE